MALRAKAMFDRGVSLYMLFCTADNFVARGHRRENVAITRLKDNIQSRGEDITLEGRYEHRGVQQGEYNSHIEGMKLCSRNSVERTIMHQGCMQRKHRRQRTKSDAEVVLQKGKLFIQQGEGSHTLGDEG